jgi:hypothetical protein
MMGKAIHVAVEFALSELSTNWQQLEDQMRSFLLSVQKRSADFVHSPNIFLL